MPSASRRERWYTSDRRYRLPSDWGRRKAAVRARAHGRCQAASHAPGCNGVGTECDHIVAATTTTSTTFNGCRTNATKPRPSGERRTQPTTQAHETASERKTTRTARLDATPGGRGLPGDTGITAG